MMDWKVPPSLLEAGRRGLQRISLTVLAGLTFLGFAIFWTLPSSVSPTEIIPDYGDPLHLAWVMAWSAHQLVNEPLALFESNSFYPYARSLAFGDHLLPETVLAAPVFWATENAVLASNVVLLVGLASSGFAMFLLVHHLTGSPGAALGAGLFYGFNTFTLTEILRVHVVQLQWWPLSLLCLDWFMREQRVKPALLLVATLALQGLSCSYYLVYTALIAPMWLAGAYVLSHRRPTARGLRALLLSVVLFAIPVALLLWPYVTQFRVMGFEKQQGAGVDLASYVLPGPQHWFYGRVAPFGGETSHFLGFLGLALIGLGAFRLLSGRERGRGRVTGMLALGTAGVGFLLSLGGTIRMAGVPLAPGPYELLQRYLPFARGMAGPTRMAVLVNLGGAVLVGLALAALLTRVRGRVRLATVGLLALLLPLEHWSPPQTGVAIPTGDEVPRVYRWLAEDGRDPMVELPLHPDVAKRFWAVYLYFSTYHWRPVPIGRTSFYPPSHDILAWYLRSFPDETSITLLGRLGIRTLLVHPLTWPTRDRARHLAALEAEPRLTLVERFDETPSERFSVLELGGERVYRVAEEDSVRPAPPCVPVGELPRGGWRLSASGRSDPEAVRDGSRRTAWRSRVPQRRGDHFTLTLPQTTTVSAVVLDMAYPFDEFPRGLRLLVKRRKEHWRSVAFADGPDERLSTIDGLVRHPRDARLVLRFPSQSLWKVKLELAPSEQSDAWPSWAIPELHVYEGCR